MRPDARGQGTYEPVLHRHMQQGCCLRIWAIVASPSIQQWRQGARADAEAVTWCHGRCQDAGRVVYGGSAGHTGGILRQGGYAATLPRVPRAKVHGLAVHAPSLRNPGQSVPPPAGAQCQSSTAGVCRISRTS